MTMQEYHEHHFEVTPSTPSDSELCLLLLGKTGHGKSATGNSILGVKRFKSSSRADSVTTYADLASAIFNGRRINVVDTPGVCDTRLDTDESLKLANEGFSRGMALCPDGFHALLLIFKFGVRMTDEERDAIAKLKEMLGQDIIREHTVLLITYGDNFDPDEEDNMTFKEWCQRQTGYMRDLLNECENRFVLFNNKTKNKDELSCQRQELLDHVDGLQSKGKRYTNWMFDEAKEIWIKLSKERKYTRVIHKVNTALDDLSRTLQATKRGEIETSKKHFDWLRAQLRELKDLIEDLEEPEEVQMRVQINNMRKLVVQVEKERDDFKRHDELSSLCTHAKGLELIHKEKVKQYQQAFVQEQERIYEYAELQERQLDEIKYSPKVIHRERGRQNEQVFVQEQERMYGSAKWQERQLDEIKYSPKLTHKEKVRQNHYEQVFVPEQEQMYECAKLQGRQLDEFNYSPKLTHKEKVGQNHYQQVFVPEQERMYEYAKLQERQLDGKKDSPKLIHKGNVKQYQQVSVPEQERMYSRARSQRLRSEGKAIKKRCSIL